MPQARISSLDALREVKTAIQRFIEEAASAISEVEGDGQRTEQWLRYEQVGYWQAQVRRRHDAVEAAKSELRRKQLTAAPDTPTAIDERRAVDRARRRVDEAEETLKKLRRWMLVLEREFTLYKGQVQSLSEVLSRDLPSAIVRLDKMIAGIEAYASLVQGAPAAAAPAGSAPLETPAPPDSAAPAPRLSALRRRSPGPSQRRATIASEIGASSVIPRPDGLDGPPSGVLAYLGIAGVPPPAQGLVIVEDGALDAPAFHLHRQVVVAEAAQADSGWYIGHASAALGPAGGLMGMSVSDLLTRRPGLSEVLELPPAWLVVVVAGGIEAILNAEDTLVYGHA